jgi:hypothetical protein
MACYGDSFTFYLVHIKKSVVFFSEMFYLRLTRAVKEPHTHDVMI